MRDYLLLLFALVLFIPIFVVGHAIHLYKNVKHGSFSMRGYVFNVAEGLDKAGGAMLFNSNGYSISAMSHTMKYRWFENVINWIFRDPEHCKKAWTEEIWVLSKQG